MVKDTDEVSGWTEIGEIPVAATIPRVGDKVDISDDTDPEPVLVVKDITWHYGRDDNGLMKISQVVLYCEHA